MAADELTLWRSSTERFLRRTVPPRFLGVARRTTQRSHLRRYLRPVRWGNTRRTVPFSARWGADRGTPIDRYYIDSFLSDRRHLIRGRTLEVRDDRYVRRFGGAVTSVDVLDIDPRNAEATIVADLAEEGSLPTAAFDCIVVTQTLQYVFDLHAAMRNLWASLAPGGTLFVSVPAVSKVEPSLVDVDSWRLLPAGLQHLLKATCPSASIDRRSYGNVLVCTAFLLGVAAEELRAGELDRHDDLFVLINCVAVTKPAEHDVAATGG